jgi:hypothetical protein
VGGGAEAAEGAWRRDLTRDFGVNRDPFGPLTQSDYWKSVQSGSLPNVTVIQ